MTLKRIHIVGRKNSGKTTLIVEIVRHLSSQGYRVGTIKHTHHDHELDTPGKDSHRHREAGSKVVGILSHKMTAVFQPTENNGTRSDDRYASVTSMFSDCDLVLVEGDLATTWPRVEVWRTACQQPPIAAEDSSISSIISDEAVNIPIPRWNRSEVAILADKILRLADAV